MTLPDITMSASSPHPRPAAPRRAKSDAEIINTPFPATQTQTQQKQYASPTEASYASLDRARSLAIAAAVSAASLHPSPAATQYTSFPAPPVSFLRTGSFHSPFPPSAFSDYGSTPCSTAAFTPREDPFEYDSSAARSCAEQDYFALGTGGQDDYAAFAHAVERVDYSFVLPSFPPKRLVEKRPAFRPEAQQQQQRMMSPPGVEETPALDPFTLEKPQEEGVRETVEERYVTDTSASPKTPVADCAEAQFLNVLDGGSADLYAGGEMFPFDCFLEV